MIDVKNYLDDGANYKAQAILAIIRGYREEIAEVANHPESVMVNVGRFENCREQGYVFSIWYEYKFIKHYAVYEHRNSDNICVLVKHAQRRPNVRKSRKIRCRQNFPLQRNYRCSRLHHIGNAERNKKRGL